MNETKPRLDALERLLEDGRPRSALETAAIRRQMVDLQTGHERGLVWREDEACRAAAFFGLLKHWKGEFGGKPFKAEPWQEHGIIAPLFGWYREDGTRRFRGAYAEQPRKQGKTTLAAGFALQGLVADSEAGAEVYAAATMRDQATILFNDSQNMARQSAALMKHLQMWKHSITCPANSGTFKPLSSDHNSLHGLNISRAIVDEVHSHKTRDLWDVLMTATGARKNPLILAITTAGYDRSSICWELHEYTRKVNEGVIEDDSWFGFIACADAEDDPFDPVTWHKANPNLDISIKSDYLRQESRKAKESPSYENTFRRLHLSQWTEQSVRWLPMHAWDACKADFNEEDLRGEPCFAGLDLASTRDVNSLVLYFPERHCVLPYFWVPKEAHDDAAARDRRQVMNWANNRFIKTTDGNTTDYAVIVRDICELSGRFDIQKLGYDPWGPANAMVQSLQSEGFDGSKLEKFPQSFSGMAAPTKELERLVFGKKLQHDNDPVLRWMASNVTVKQDPAGNIRPDKGKSSDKIDGIVALIMALGLSMRYGVETQWYVPGGLAL